MNYELSSRQGAKTQRTQSTDQKVMCNPELRTTTEGTELTEDTETEGRKKREGHKDKIIKLCVILISFLCFDKS